MLKFRRLMGGVMGVSALLLVVLFATAGANSDGSWLSPSSLVLQKQADLSTVPPSLNGNVDCFSGSNGSCEVNTAYGTVSSSLGVRLANTSSYRQVISYIDNRQHFIAIPGSSAFITYTTEPVYGLYLYFNYNFSSSIALTGTGLNLQYTVTRPPDGRLKDRDNHRLAADPVSISFSSNGQWMVVSEPNVAMLRVNLQTFDVLPFAPGFDYSIGLSPGPQTAITNDGRYAVVASKDFSRFNLYDLSTCSSVPSTITGPVSCQPRNLQDFMRQQVGGYGSSYNLRFISDNTLSLYANYSQGSVNKIAKFILSTSAGDIHQQDYLALGDSYISGEGAFQYLEGTDTSDNTCHVSLVSYPYLLGQYLNYNSYHSVACSGAVMNDITDTGDEYKGQTKNKISRQSLDRSDSVSLILGDFQQGYIDQLDFVSRYQPRAITLSVGGNDIGFSAKLRSCIEPGTCFSTYEDRLEFVREVNSKFPALVDTYTKIKNAGAPDANIYVIGYPQIAKAGGDCALNVHLDGDELAFTQQAISYLDSVIKAAADRAGVFYVDAEDALNGHRLCEAGPGSVAMNGLTAGNDFPDTLGGPIGRESYHPNDFGHLLLENKILEATHNLTNPMPSANLSAAPPAEAGLPILNAPRSGRAVNVAEYDASISDDLIYKQTPANLVISGTNHSLKPSATLQASLHSDPISLGNFTTDGSGNLLAQIVLPASVPPGYHSLHLYGTDVSGQPIDIYKIVYVGASPGDLDGDGLADGSQACVGVLPSGQDLDQDGLDDACDGYIAAAPVVSGPPAPVSGESGGVELSDPSLEQSQLIPAFQISVADMNITNDSGLALDRPGVYEVDANATDVTMPVPQRFVLAGNAEAIPGNPASPSPPALSAYLVLVLAALGAACALGYLLYWVFA